MTPIIFTDIPFQIDLLKLADELHISPNAETFPQMEQLWKTAAAIGRPKGLYLESVIQEKGHDFITISGIRFNSRILRVNLEKETKAYPFIVTCGGEFAEWLDRITDVLERFWGERIVESALDSALTAVKERIGSQSQVQNLAMMNPGSLEDWPIEEQQKLFAILGNPKVTIGVELTDSFLMKPVKSISGIFFSSEEHYVNCRLCPREGCPGRRAPYEKELSHERYFTP